MADEFDIDIYGDLNPDEPSTDNRATKKEADLVKAEKDSNSPPVRENWNSHEDTKMGSVASEGDSVANTAQHKEEHPTQTNQKRKLDDRLCDPNAMSALYIADLNWWTTDDDIRGWVNHCDFENELKDITFSEHKVNGKSKGVAFIEFTTAQAAAAVKSKIESDERPAYMGKRHSVTFTNPNSNPFRTLPKDTPQRDRPFTGGRSGDRGGQSPGGMGSTTGMPISNTFRTTRGNFGGPSRNNIGSPFMSARGAFAGALGGTPASPQGSFQGAVGSAFAAPNMQMQQFGAGTFQGNGFQGRGINPMRGAPHMRGRGTMGVASMIGGPMSGMGNGAGPGLGMGHMGGGMNMMDGGGFNPMGGSFNMGGMSPASTGYPSPHFNPAFFSGGHSGPGVSQNPQGSSQGHWVENPHPAKRARPNE